MCATERKVPSPPIDTRASQFLIRLFSLRAIRALDGSCFFSTGWKRTETRADSDHDWIFERTDRICFDCLNAMIPNELIFFTSHLVNRILDCGFVIKDWIVHSLFFYEKIKKCTIFLTYFLWKSKKVYNFLTYFLWKSKK